ncbi:beta-lactamase family protein [Annulohypoxylon maeteangense]|uniref:beta-lactamase family protein n=1 Tax=Annulohypoxylon maeteangense TaxID=1927788 RepID=UPI002007460B|nr:beta-lactamase family protein [Annulohypoxylon maeteangense]KAI0881637.1 beta-lactamase family protein [Annulohypoxylon maeteangense]
MDFFRSNSFSSQVRNMMAQNHVPGLSIAIIQDDEVASAGYGYATLDPEKPCTADTLFDIASCSKSMTAASVALLVEDNKNHPEVQWDAIMSSLLPEDFAMPNPEDSKLVTLDDVVSHMTGMAYNEAALMGPTTAQGDNARSITRNLRNLPMLNPVRTKWEYCNLMFTAAAHLVAEKSGKTFNDFLEERIFGPLNMTSTSFQPASAISKGFEDRMAKGHDWNKEEEKYLEFPQITSPEGEGAGCVVTCANDFIKWVKAYLKREGPISQKVYRELTRLRAITDPTGKMAKFPRSPEMYAAGLEVFWYRGYTVVGHWGGVPGFSSRFFFLPEINFGACFMGNSPNASTVFGAIGKQLMDAALKLPPVPRLLTKKDGNKPKTIPKPAKTSLAVRPKDQSIPQSESASNDTKDENQPGDEPQKEQPDDKKATEEPEPKPKKQKQKEKEKKPKPQTKPLSDYVGKYWNPGYRRMTVSIKDDKLFIDCMDRAYYGYTITFKHVANQTKYTAHIDNVNDVHGDDIRAQFVFDESGRAVKMGLKMESELKHLIWFELEKDT